MTALSNIEAKKKFEFLEAVSGSMDAHLRYFKQVNISTCVYITHMFRCVKTQSSRYQIADYNILDAVSSLIQGYELLHQMEPYIHQVKRH